MNYENISLVSVTMDRHENIIASLHTWLKYPFGEIIIIDWCSKTDLKSMIPSYFKQYSDRIKIYKVTGYDKWVLTWAFNFALFLANKEIILKLDADIIIVNDILSNIMLNENNFISGNYNSVKPYLSGSFMVYKKNLVYYNEYIQSYGWDDNDIYTRLIANKLEQKFFDLNLLDHIETTNFLRIKNNRDDLSVDNIVNITIYYNCLLTKDKSFYHYNLNRYKKIDEYQYTIIDTELLPIDHEKYYKSLKNYYVNKLKKSESDLSLYNVEQLKNQINSINNKLDLAKKNLFLEVLNGTCNRLRTLIGAVVFCRMYGYKLFVLWKQTYGYNDSDFIDYFNYMNLKEITFIRKIPDDIVFDCIYDYKLNDYKITSDMLVKINNLKIRSSATFHNHFNFLDTTQYNIMYDQELLLLQPNIKVKIIIDHIMSYYNIPSEYMAMHIRRGDAIIAPNIGIHYKKSSIYMFTQIVLKEYNDTNQKIIVVTDDKDYVEKFFNILCPNMYTIISEPYEIALQANPIKNYILKDVVDLFILAGAIKIYGTNFSSYSKLAAQLLKKSHLNIVIDIHNYYLPYSKKSINIDTCIKLISMENLLPYITDYIDTDSIQPDDYVDIFENNKDMIIYLPKKGLPKENYVLAVNMSDTIDIENSNIIHFKIDFFEMTDIIKCINKTRELLHLIEKAKIVVTHNYYIYLACEELGTKAIYDSPKSNINDNLDHYIKTIYDLYFN
jgi:hypothetical protein